MDVIFFEHQSGNLCAQHCLNALLQAPLLTAVDLAEIARRLDEQERAVGATEGTAASQNMDDSGYFSVQVMGEALKVFDLQLVPLANPSVKHVADEPAAGKFCRGYVCNMREHWFAIRHLGAQWFDLNSTRKGPQLISNTYLHLYINQLQNEGYTVFAVLGQLPKCEADEFLIKNPVKPEKSENKDQNATENQAKTVEPWTGTGVKLSTGVPVTENGNANAQDSESAQLEEAIRLSLAETNGIAEQPPSSNSSSTQQDLRAKRQAFLDKLAPT